MIHLNFFDTTLRDGQQGIGFLLEDQDKIEVFKDLLKLNLNTIELGMVLTTEDEVFFTQASKIQTNDTTIAALCRLNIQEINKTILSLSKFKKSSLNLLCVGSEIHVNGKFKKDKEYVKKMLIDSLKYAVEVKGDVSIQAILEDSTRGSFKFIQESIAILTHHGIVDICFADTTGIATPTDIHKMLNCFMNLFPKVNFSIHCHNDLGLAVANSIAAIDAGIKEVQVTLGGVGERCGNASLEEILAILKITNIYREKYRTNISLSQVIRSCENLYSILGKKPYKNKPLIGEYAFATCAGIHQDGISKSPETYEAINPELLGVKRKFIFNKLSSKKINKSF